MAALLSYHGDRAVKEMYLARITAHEAADELAKGRYWQDGKGCAVGCLVHCGDSFRVHSLFPTAEGPGWPEWLARLADAMFEGVPNDHAKTFPRRLVEAIPVGVDLDRVRYRFALVLLAESAERVKRLDIDAGLKAKVLAAVEDVAVINRGAAETGKWAESSAGSAESAAWSAESAARSAESAWSSAWSAESAWSSAESAGSAAWSARSAAWSARSAAWSAAWSARSAASAESAAWSAWSAARSAESAESAWSAAWSAAYIRYANALIVLLQESGNRQG